MTDRLTVDLVPTSLNLTSVLACAVEVSPEVLLGLQC